METIGVRELKNTLSRVLKRIQAGARIVVTDRGKPVAVLERADPTLKIETPSTNETSSPAPPEEDLAWIHRMVAEGKAQWSGRKPDFSKPGVKPRKGSPLASDIVSELRGPR